VGLLFSETTETSLFLRVDQVDCAHGELRKAMGPADGTPQRLRITHIHPTPALARARIYVFALPMSSEKMYAFSSEPDGTRSARGT